MTTKVNGESNSTKELLEWCEKWGHIKKGACVRNLVITANYESFTIVEAEIIVVEKSEDQT